MAREPRDKGAPWAGRLDLEAWKAGGGVTTASASWCEPPVLFGLLESIASDNWPALCVWPKGPVGMWPKGPACWRPKVLSWPVRRVSRNGPGDRRSLPVRHVSTMGLGVRRIRICPCVACRGRGLVTEGHCPCVTCRRWGLVAEDLVFARRRRVSPKEPGNGASRVADGAWWPNVWSCSVRRVSPMGPGGRRSGLGPCVACRMSPMPKEPGGGPKGGGGGTKLLRTSAVSFIIIRKQRQILADKRVQACLYLIWAFNL